MNRDKPWLEPYHRPHQMWECGSQGEDCLCLAGPSSNGVCRSPNSNCRPRLTPRGRKRVFVVCCFAVTLAYLVLGFWQPWRSEFVSPGPLTSVHARLPVGSTATLDDLVHTTGAETSNCLACHEAAGSSPLEWMATVFNCGQAPGPVQSQRCLDCHQAELGSVWAMQAHGVDPKRLAAITSAKHSELAAKPSAKLDLWTALTSNKTPGSIAAIDAGSDQAVANSESIACATCHREHHGPGFDLKTMTDRQCQGCHATSHRSFVDGHPEFTNWPRFANESNLAFTHVAHMGKHFPAKNRAFECQQCHLPDVAGASHRLVGFETACASCHDKGLEAAGAEGLPIVALPTLDAQALARHGAKLPGDWPSEARGEFDGKLPEIMVLLLSADSQARNALDRLAPKFDVATLDPANADDARHAAALAKAIRRLFDEAAGPDRAALRQRVEIVAGEKLDDRRFARLVNRLPLDLFADARRVWFGQATASQRVDVSPTDSAWQFVVQAVDAKKELLRANPLESLRGAASPMPELSGKPAIAPAASTTNSPAPGAAKQPAPGTKGPPRPASNPKGELLRANPLAPLATTVDPALLSASPKQPTPPKQVAPATSSSEPLVEKPIATPKPTPIAPSSVVEIPPGGSLDAQWAATGGWFRDDRSLTIRYRPEGHADALSAAWLELATRHVREPAADHALKAFARSPALASCVQCHAATGGEHPGVEIAWKAQDRDPSTRTFTRFTHDPHTLSGSTGECLSCHRPNESLAVSATIDALRDQSPATHLPRCDFLPIGKATCATCHNATAASQSCTTCHRYHVNDGIDARARVPSR